MKGKKPRGAEEIILEVLREDSKTPKDLLHECINRGVKKPTYYRQLEKLIKNQDVEDAKYRFVGEIEADETEVRDCIGYLKKYSDNKTLENILQGFLILCNARRVAHFGGVLYFFISALDDFKFNSPNLLSKIIRSFYCVLNFETKRRVIQEQVIKQLTKPIDKIGKILKTAHDPELIGESLFYLAKTGEKTAFKIILKTLQQLSEEDYKKVNSSLSMALFSKDFPLYTKFHRVINKTLYDMLEDSNPLTKQKATSLLKAKPNYRMYP